MSLPRFPQPFLELLSTILPWRDILSLLSVDKREQPMRRFWINCRSRIMAQRLGELTRFYHDYPQCIVYDKIISGRQRLRKETNCLEFKTAVPKNLNLSQLVDLSHVEFGLETDLEHLNSIIWPLNVSFFHFGMPEKLPTVPKIPGSVVELSMIGVDDLHFQKQIMWPPLLKKLSLREVHPEIIFPLTLTHLKITVVNQDQKRPNWPSSLTHLSIDLFDSERLNSSFLPCKLEYLHIGGSVYGLCDYSDFEWPIGLKYLLLGNSSNIIGLDNLPETLIRLEFDPKYTDIFKQTEPHIPPEYVPLVGAASRKADNVVKRRRLKQCF